VRRDDEILLVQQGEPGGELHWSLPGGVLEEDELLHEGLAREVREEAGLEIAGPLRLAFVVQVDNRRPEPLRLRDREGIGYLATVWTFEIGSWWGEVGPRDPDGLVREARFVPLDEATRRLEAVPWHELTVGYVRGELEPGSVHLRRWHADGGVDVL
jgi:8-oxo-dGTP diphosphatase